jgi:hypothetical protein
MAFAGMIVIMLGCVEYFEKTSRHVLIIIIICQNAK